MIYDLIGHGVTIAVVIYVGLHLRSQLRGEKRQKLAEIKSTLAGITRAGRERVETLERQLAIETESPQDL